MVELQFTDHMIFSCSHEFALNIQFGLKLVSNGRPLGGELRKPDLHLNKLNFTSSLSNPHL